MQPDGSWDIGGAIFILGGWAVIFLGLLAREWLACRRMRDAWRKAVDWMFGDDLPETEWLMPERRRNAEATKCRGFKRGSA